MALASIGLVQLAWGQADQGEEILRAGAIEKYYPILSRLHTPQLVPQTSADSLFGLFDAGDAWPGDSSRYHRLLDLASRFAPILQSTNFSIPRDFEQMLALQFADTIACRPAIRLARHVWRLDRPTPDLVQGESSPLEIGLRAGALCLETGKGSQVAQPGGDIDGLRKLLRTYDPWRSSQPGRRGDRDTVLFWNFPGVDPQSWRRFYRHIAADPRVVSRVYVHPFLYPHQGATGQIRGWELVLQYWFFYPFNDGVNDHEGDWEHINVSLTTRARAAGGHRYGRLLDSTDVGKILADTGGLSSDSLTISAVDYYYHHWVATIDYKPLHDPEFVKDTVPYDLEFQERFGARLSVTPASAHRAADSTVRIDEFRPSGHDDPQFKADPSLGNRPVVYIGGANKSVLQLFRTASQENKNTHGSYPYPGLWLGIGTKATERIFGRYDRAYEVRAPAKPGPGTTVVPNRGDLVLLPDWEGLYRQLLMPQTSDRFVREWAWLVLPIRWGYPATRSVGSDILGDFDLGNVSPIGPAHNPGWNRVGAGPGFDRFILYRDGRGFRRVTHDYITPQFWPLTVLTIGTTLLPPFNAVGNYLVSTAKSFSSHRAIYQGSPPPKRVFDFVTGFSVRNSGHGFHIPSSQPLLSQAAQAFGSSFGGITAARADNSSGTFGLSTHLSETWATETALVLTKGVLVDSIVDQGGDRVGTLERQHSAAELYGGFRHSPSLGLPVDIQPFWRLAYGWSWYGLARTARFRSLEGTVLDSLPVSRPPGGRFPLGVLPNSGLVGIGLELRLVSEPLWIGVRGSFNLFATKRLPGRSELLLQAMFGV